MAIKLSGSVIIDDSRNIIDASSVGIGTTIARSDLDVRGSVVVNTNSVSSVSVGNSIYVGDQVALPYAFEFTPDGKNIYVLHTSDITHYRLEDPWSVGSASTYVGEYNFTNDGFSGTGYDLKFSPDGRKLYILNSNDAIGEFDLEKSYDFSTITYSGISTLTTSQESDPRVVEFKPDGTKMWVIGAAGDAIYQYTLSTPWKIDTATYDSISSSVRFSGDCNILGLRFTNDGTQIYLLDFTSSKLVHYSTSTPWDVSSLTFLGEIVNINTESGESAARGLYVRSDLSKIYIGGSTNDRIYELDVNKENLSDLSVVGTINVGELKAYQNITAYGGVRSFGESSFFGNVGIGTDSAYDYSLTVKGQSDIQNISRVNKLNESYVENAYSFWVGNEALNPNSVGFNTVGDKMYILSASDVIWEYDLNTPWRVSTASYTGNNLSINAEDSGMVDFKFQNDGTKLFAVGVTNDKIYEYSIATPWDLSTASLTTSRTVPSTNISGFDISPDGTKAVFTGSNTYDPVYEYTFGTPWDIDTLVGPSTSTYVAFEETAPTGVSISSDGTRMYTVGTNGDAIDEYQLNTAFDIRTAVYTGNTLSVVETSPQDIYLKPDGTQIFIVGVTNDLVRTFNLATPFDLSTATTGGTFSVATEEVNPYGLFFKDDGTEMYICGDSNTLNQYTLSSAWDVTTASIKSRLNFGVFGENRNINWSTLQKAVAISTTGESLYLIDGYNVLNHLPLSTPWEISSVSVASTTGITTAYNLEDFSGNPTGLSFSNDGSKLYVIGSQKDSVVRYDLSTPWDINTLSTSNSSIDIRNILGNGHISVATVSEDSKLTIKYNSTGTKLYILGGTNDLIYQYSLSTPYDLSTAYFDGNYRDVSRNDLTPTGIFVGDSDNTLYYTGTSNDRVFEFSLINGNVSNAKCLDDSYRFTIDGFTQDNIPEGITFSPDGLYMYMVGSQRDAILQYRLKSPWDIRDPEIIDVFDLDNPDFAFDVNETEPSGIEFSDDGTILFILGRTSDEVISFKLSVPWRIGTIFQYLATYYLSNYDTNPEGIRFGKKGYKMYIIGNAGNDINEFTLTTPWDVKTAGFTTSFALRDTSPKGLAFSKDGGRFFVCGSTGNYVNEYKVNTLWDLNTASFVDRYYLGNKGITSPTDLYVTGDRKYFFILDSGEYGVFKYTIPTNDISLGSDVNISGGIEVNQDSKFRSKIEANRILTNSIGIGTNIDKEYNYGIVSTKKVDLSSIGKVGNTISKIQRHSEFVSPSLSVISKLTTSGTVSAYHIDSTGTRVYWTSTSGYLSQGKLTTPWDLSTLVHLYNYYLYETSPDVTPQQLTVDPTGQYVYISYASAGSNVEYNYIVQYEMTNWNITTLLNKYTINPSGSLLTNNEYIFGGLRFKSDGTKIYFSSNNDRIYEFSLGSAWNISTISRTPNYVFDTSIANLPANLDRGFDFNDDGTKLYINDANAYDSKNLYIINLSTAWDLSTANWTGLSYSLRGLSGQFRSFQIIDSKTFLVLSYNLTCILKFELEEDWNFETVKPLPGIAYNPAFVLSSYDRWKITPDGRHLVTYNGLVFGLRTPWDITSIEQTDYQINRAIEFGTINGMKFSPDGTKMIVAISFSYNDNYVFPSYNTIIAEYVMEGPYAFDTLKMGYVYQHANATNLQKVYSYSFDLDISPDGKKLFLLDSTDDSIETYDLLEPWKLSSIRRSEPRHRVNRENGTPYSLTFGSDGYTLFVNGNGTIYQYSLNEPYDVRTSQFTGITSTTSGTTNTRGIEINNDGTKFYTIEVGSDLIHERDLTIANSVRSSGTVRTFSVASQEGDPRGFAFNSDGTSMYVLGTSSDTIYQYGLTTAFNVSSAGLTTSFNVGTDSERPFTSAEATPAGLTLGNNGYSLYFVGQTHDVVYQYDLSTRDDVSSATFKTYFNLNTFDQTPQDVTFNPEGTRMFVVGTSVDTIWQFELSTPWDINSATYTTTIKSIGGDTAFGFNNAYSMEFSPDGYSFYVYYYDGNVYNGVITQWNCSEPWNLSTAQIVDSYKISDDVKGIQNFQLSQDRDKIIVSTDNNELLELKLDWEKTVISDGLDVYGRSSFNNGIDVEGKSTFVNIGIGTTSSFYSGLTVNTNANLPYISSNEIDLNNVYSDENSLHLNYKLFGRFDSNLAWSGLSFSNDGRYMYVATDGTEANEGVAHQFKLKKPWDLRSAEPYDGLYFLQGSGSGGIGIVKSIQFSTNGDYFYFVNDQGTGYEGVYQYTLTTPWELKTAGFTTSFQVTTEDNTPKAIGFSTGGTEMYILGDQGNNITEYTLGTPWDVNTAAFSTESKNSSSLLSVPEGMYIKPDGKKLWISDSGDSGSLVYPTNNQISEWEFVVPWDISTIYYTGKSLQLEPLGLDDVRGIHFSSDGKYMGVLADGTEKVYLFTLDTPWDINTAKIENQSFVGLVDEGSIDKLTYAYSLEFSSDGYKMFSSNASTYIYEWDLSVPWDYTTRKLVRRKYVYYGFGITAVWSMKFNDDGTKLYILDGGTTSSHYIHELSLSIPWNLSTLQSSGRYDYGNQNETYDVYSMDINSDGTKLYLSGTSYIEEYEFKVPWSVETLKPAGDSVQLNSRLYDNASPNVYGIAFKPDGLRYYYVNRDNDPYRIIQIDIIGEAWDHTDYRYAGEYELTYTSSPYGLTFSSDGTKLYICDDTNKQIREHNLTTAWDITTITSSSSTLDTHLPGTSTDYAALDVKFNEDGDKMYVTDNTNGFINQYALSSSWDITSATHDVRFNVRVSPSGTRAQDIFYFAENNPTTLEFNKTGKILYVTGTYSGRIHQYELETAWDISTIKPVWSTTWKTDHAGYTFSVDGVVNGMYYKDDSTIYMLAGNTLDRLYKCKLADKDDISTIYIENKGFIDVTFDQTEEFISTIYGLSISPCGRYLYIAGPAGISGQSAKVRELELVKPYQLHGARLTERYFSFSNEQVSTVPYSLRLAHGATELIMSFSIEGNNFGQIKSWKLPYKPTTVIGKVNISGDLNVDSEIKTSVLKANTSNLRNVSIGDTQFSNQQSLVVHGSADIRKISNKTALNKNTLSVNYESYPTVYQDTSPTSLVSNPTGTKIIMLGITNDALYEYELSTPWDIRTAKYTYKSKELDEFNTPTGLYANDEGTKFYITDETTNFVYQYDASIPWNVNSLGFTTSFDASSQDADIQAIHLTGAGTTMYLVGHSADSVYQYSLSNAWDVSTASLTTSFAVGTEDNTPTGLTFNNDESKMYICGQQNDRIYEYSLSVPADIGTASLTTSFPISDYTNAPEDIFMSSDGNKILFIHNDYMEGFKAIGLTSAYNLSSAQKVYGIHNGYDVSGAIFNSNMRGFYIRPDGLKLWEIEYNDANYDIYEWNLSTPWEVSTASYSNSYNLSDNYYGIDFKPDGTKMYLTNYDNATTSSIHEYTLSSAWDISSATLTYNFVTGTFDTGADDNQPIAVRFSSDGKRMWVLGDGNDYFFPYEMTTPWDLSTAREVSQDWLISAIDNDPRGVAWNYDGTKIFFGGNQNDRVYQLSIPPENAWDIRYATNPGISTTINDTVITGLTFGDSGSKMYIVGSTNDKVLQYDLSTPWDITTRSGVTTEFLISKSTEPSEVRFDETGESMFVLDRTNDQVIQYKLSTPWDCSTSTLYTTLYTGATIPGSNDYALEFGRDGTRMYIATYQNTYNTYQYDLDIPWDLNSAKPTKSYFLIDYSHNRNVGQPMGMAFNSDGTEVTYVDNTIDRLVTHKLKTPWEIDTAYYDGIWTAYTREKNDYWGWTPKDFIFNSDGTKIYITSQYSSNFGLYEWDLLEPYMLWTAKYGGRVDLQNYQTFISDSYYLEGTYFTAPENIFISPANDKLYIRETTSDYYGIYQFNLEKHGVSIESDTNVSGKLSASTIDASSAKFGNLSATGTLSITGGIISQSQLLFVDSGNADGSTVLNGSYNYFRYTATGNYTISFTGITNNRAWFGTLELTNGGAYTVTWDSAIKWPGGVAPTLSSSGTDVIQFVSSDGGLNIRGILSIADSQ